VNVHEGLGPSFSPDGKQIVFTQQVSGPDWGLRILDLGSEEAEPVAFLTETGFQDSPKIAPDGRYLAYTSDETRTNDVYVRPFPSGDGKWQVSVDGGFWPRWSRNGERLYYVNGETLYEVDVSTEPAFRLGQPREIFTREPLGWTLIFGWPPGFDVSADGERFVVCRAVEQERSTSGVIIVENWLGEFESRAAAGP
jgi:hypothetical protein